MGATSELHIKMQEEREQLIDKFKSKEMRLSYSTLKNFTSPKNLINYKLRKFSPTPSMIFGSLCDVLLLTPQNFSKEYKIVDNIPTTDKQSDFCNEIVQQGTTDIEETKLKSIFSNHYSRGDVYKTLNPLKDYIDGKISGKELITQDIYNEAILITENLMNNEDIQSIFEELQSVQTKVQWQDRGWNFIGFLDMLLDDHIIDLKFSKDSNPEKFERDIANFDYFLQAAMYVKATVEMGLCKDPKYSFIVYDKSGNYSIIELDYSYLKYGERKYNYLLQELDKCIESNSFNESYNFFKKSYIIFKPKWAKGFELKEE